MAQETAQNKLAREQTEKTNAVDHDWPRDAFGTPMVKITVGATELIPTTQFGNITIGPVAVTRFVVDGPDDHLMQALRDTKKMCEIAVSEEYEFVHKLVQARAGK